MSRRGFGEYPGSPTALPINTVRDPKQGRGPLHSPIINPDDPRDDSWMDRLWRRFEALGILEPNEIQSFINGTSGTNLVANAPPVAIATFQMPSAEDGYMTEFWVNVAPPGNANIVLWQIQVNGGVHPQFNNVIIPALNLWTGFKVKVNRGQTITLLASSTGAPAVSGMIRGWGRLIPDVP